MTANGTPYPVEVTYAYDRVAPQLFAQQGGKLTIETRNVFLNKAYARGHQSVTEGAYVLLAMSDTGVGMDSETQAHAFEPFFTTKAHGKGTGLGLATCYGIIKQHDGRLDEGVAFLHKPFTPAVLVRKVREVLDE